MNARDRICSAIDRCELPDVALPDLQQDWIQYPNPLEQFARSLEAVGGQFVDCESIASIQSTLKGHSPYTNANNVFSNLPDITEGTVDLERIEDPHALDDLDFALFRAQFGVAENGAVWLTADNLRHRVTLFIAQHLAVVVPRGEIVNNMHEAYQRITFTEAGFGLFMSGPSKTADIEQSLVIGAHGARSLIVFAL